MIVLGISAYYHDSAAALVKDGVVIAAVAEERFIRVKHYKGFPVKACEFCLSYASITIDQVDTIIFYEKPFLKFERIIRTHVNYAPKGLRTFLSAIPIWLKERLNLRKTISEEIQKAFHTIPKHISFCQHHFSHAALAFYTSSFERSAILVIDAVGEDATSSILKASKEGIELVKMQHFPHSLGLLYSSFTYYLGFKVNSDEYKVMGLAPYGDEKSDAYKLYRDIIVNNLVEIRKDGSLKLNCDYFTFMYADRMVDDRKWERLFGFPKRKPHDNIENCHRNMALAIQHITEEIMQKMAAFALQSTEEHKLCVAGGCALNSVAIGKLKSWYGPDNVYVSYAAGDDGAAVGCALYMSFLNGDTFDNARNPYLGPQFSNHEIREFLDREGISYDDIDNPDVLNDLVTDEIDKGRIVGWFQGRMEFGPRALGNRSILADPRKAEMKDLVNMKVKYRESFRPFAPAVLEEYANSIFEIEEKSPYMVATYRKRDNTMDLPAITHIDKTARIQTVSKLNNEKFYSLLRKFYMKTGCPVLLNTSFNVMGEPIVCTPADAFETFMSSGIEVLVMNNFIVRKK